MLDDVDIEEGKRDLITREIGKFREIMKVKTISFLPDRAKNFCRRIEYCIVNQLEITLHGCVAST
jgi:hypothetical protein